MVLVDFALLANSVLVKLNFADCMKKLARQSWKALFTAWVRQQCADVSNEMPKFGD